MHRLADYPLKDPPKLTRLRAAAAKAPEDAATAIKLGLALHDDGCNYQAAMVLRPRRDAWKGTPAEPKAKAALDARAWWNKHGQEFARLKHRGDRVGALALLDGRETDYWDQPALLIHLSDFAAGDGDHNLAVHLLERVAHLAEQGLPRMDMSAFAYVAPAGMVDLLLKQGKAKEARAAFEKLIPNPGNAMGHEILGIRVLVSEGAHDAAMAAIARLLVTAGSRKGYSREIRAEFVERSEDLAPLRRHADWSRMIGDPKALLTGN